MSKTKKSKSIIIITILALTAVSLLWFLNNEDVENNSDGFTVCYAPENCKTISGVPEEAVLSNIIGHPKDFHRENSNTAIDIQAGFDKGRFDEKSFYFSYKNRVYYFINAKIFTGFSEEAGLLKNSDAETFELIDANFSKDKENVYGRTNLEASIAYKIIEQADSETFIPLDWPYARDKNNIYYLNTQIENADSGSFQILDNKLCGQDKDNYYKDGEISNEVDCK